MTWGACVVQLVALTPAFESGHDLMVAESSPRLGSPRVCPRFSPPLPLLFPLVFSFSKGLLFQFIAAFIMSNVTKKRKK